MLGLLLALLPLVFAGIAGVLNQYPYLMVGFVGLVLFHAFRLQAVPKTALVGVLLQTFAIMLPIATGQSEQAGGALSGAFALNGVLAVAGLYLAFALFPAHRVSRPGGPSAAAGRPAGADAQCRRRGAGDAAGIHAAAGLQPDLGDAGAFHHRHRAGLAQPA